MMCSSRDGSGRRSDMTSVGGAGGRGCSPPVGARGPEMTDIAGTLRARSAAVLSARLALAVEPGHVIRRVVLGLAQVARDRARSNPEARPDRRDTEPAGAQVDDDPPALRDVLV